MLLLTMHIRSAHHLLLACRGKVSLHAFSARVLQSFYSRLITSWCACRRISLTSCQCCVAKAGASITGELLAVAAAGVVPTLAAWQLGHLT
jgi:hypothetical protein